MQLRFSVSERHFIARNWAWVPPRLTCLLCCAIVLLCSTKACAQTQHSARPHWIWAAADRKENRTIRLCKTFELAGELTGARLLLITDFADLTAVVNGTPVAELDAYAAPRELDVTDAIQRGENELCLTATSVAGPAAIAAKLEVTRRQAAPLTMVSDASWTDDSDRTAVSLGRVAAAPWLIHQESTRIRPFDDYTQWKRALGDADPDADTDAASYQIEPGFELERLKTASPDEDSWVSMRFSPSGRLVIAKEDRGLLRMSFADQGGKITKVETINDELQECRGLLFVGDALYANANNSKGLYRLRDKDGDGQYEDMKLLYSSTGGVGHGRNDLAWGPDQHVYSIHGDSVDLPVGVGDRTSPFREHHQGERTREGHVIRLDSEGLAPELIVAGLRNPYGIAFNRHGEMFTYDADAEFDMGSPWYRPTRVNHLLPGGDFGWRGVTGDWPPYFHNHPDNAPPSLDIGKGSPTAVEFGYQSNFPPEFRQALFILDWAYGRIVAVHMVPRGASYVCRAKPFLRGQPLNVTDLDFGPDGALYFITGGRKTQSGLYLVGYVGGETDARGLDLRVVLENTMPRRPEPCAGSSKTSTGGSVWRPLTRLGRTCPVEIPGFGTPLGLLSNTNHSTSGPTECLPKRT